MSSGLQLLAPNDSKERNWLPPVVAVAVLLVFVTIAFALFRHEPSVPKVLPISTPLDAYASSLPISNLEMSESANLAGGKLTYVDGHILNQGTRTVTGATVQVLFRNFAHEVVQNESQPLRLIRMRDPYIDIESVSAAPIQSGEGKDFRLIFDAVSPEWDGAYPEIRVVHVDTK